MESFEQVVGQDAGVSVSRPQQLGHPGHVEQLVQAAESNLVRA